MALGHKCLNGPSRGDSTLVGCEAAVYLMYWQCSHNWWSKNGCLGIYLVLDKCIMPALLRCLSHPCHSDDTGISSKNRSPSLSVTYSGYNECTFGPLASRRFPLWSVHPPDEKPARMSSSSICPTKIKDLESSGTCQTLCNTNVEQPGRLRSRVTIPMMVQY